jgi:hypothetical protein
MRDNALETSRTPYSPLDRAVGISRTLYLPLDRAVETSGRLDVKKTYLTKSRDLSNEVIYHLPHFSYFFQID